MVRVLNLQRLAVPKKDVGIAGSWTSSWHHCCNEN
ncbi:MAG: class III lanthipeptide [Candidatus Bipolaricaulaceae bacterium]